MLVNYSFTHCQCKDELGALWVWSITHFILSSSVYTLQYLIHTPPQLQSAVRFRFSPGFPGPGRPKSIHPFFHSVIRQTFTKLLSTRNCASYWQVKLFAQDEGYAGDRGGTLNQLFWPCDCSLLSPKTHKSETGSCKGLRGYPVQPTIQCRNPLLRRQATGPAWAWMWLPGLESLFWEKSAPAYLHLSSGCWAPSAAVRPQVSG